MTLLFLGHLLHHVSRAYSKHIKQAEIFPVFVHGAHKRVSDLVKVEGITIAIFPERTYRDNAYENRIILYRKSFFIYCSQGVNTNATLLPIERLPYPTW